MQEHFHVFGIENLESSRDENHSSVTVNFVRSNFSALRNALNQYVIVGVQCLEESMIDKGSETFPSLPQPLILREPLFEDLEIWKCSVIGIDGYEPVYCEWIFE